MYIQKNHHKQGNTNLKQAFGPKAIEFSHNNRLKGPVFDIELHAQWDSIFSEGQTPVVISRLRYWIQNTFEGRLYDALNAILIADICIAYWICMQRRYHNYSMNDFALTEKSLGTPKHSILWSVLLFIYIIIYPFICLLWLLISILKSSSYNYRYPSDSSSHSSQYNFEYMKKIKSYVQNSHFIHLSFCARRDLEAETGEKTWSHNRKGIICASD